MKKTIAIVATLLLTLSAVAQTKDSIDVSRFMAVYDYLCRTKVGKTGEAITDSAKIALLVGEKHSMQMEYTMFAYKVLDDRGKLWDAMRYSTIHIPRITTNFPEEGMMRIIEPLFPHLYAMSETVKPIKWELGDDTLSVSGYLCHNASCAYGGRTWHVWYTEEVASTAGPWCLQGLPGLVVKADDEQGIHSYCLSTLERKEVCITAPDDPKHVAIKRSKFIKIRNKLLCDKRYVEKPDYFVPEGANTCVFQHGGRFHTFLLEGNRANISISLPTVDDVHYFQPLELK